MEEGLVLIGVLGKGGLVSTFICIKQRYLCVSVCQSISCQWLLSEQNQWHIWNQQVPADVLAWF